MTLPDINRVRLQRVVSECEANFEPADFDELCDAVSETAWATKLELDVQTIADLIQHHSIETKVKVGAVKTKAKPTLPEPAHKLKRKAAPQPEPKVEAPKAEEPESTPEIPKKFYDEAGKGRKPCPACRKYVGNRSAVCTNCGHAFWEVPAPVAAAEPKTVVPPKVETPVAPPSPKVEPPKVAASVAVSVAPPPPKPVSLHKAPLRPVVEATPTSAFNREFLHYQNGEVWEIKNSVLWQVDSKTHEPLNDRKYQWKFDEEWSQSFLTNVESNVAMWVEQGHRRPPNLPEGWLSRTERLQERLNNEQALALAGAGIADSEVSDGTGE